MRFYYGCNVDSAGRICLGALGKGFEKVLVYMTDESNDLVYLKRAPLGEIGDGYTVRHIDAKHRISLPKWARGDAKRALVAKINEPNTIVIKFIP